MNIVLILVDALRRDKIGAYTDSKNTLTPNIDELAKKGTLLNQHFTVLNCSTPVQISLFTGNYPSTHGVHENGYKLPKKYKTLAEYLTELNYITGGFVSSGAISSIYNFNKGFEYFYDNSKYDKLMFWARKAGTKRYNVRKVLRDIVLKKFGFFDVFTKTGDKTNKTALKWLEDHHKEKFFLYIHYFDIHEDVYGERTKSQDKIKNYDENVKMVDVHVGEIIKKIKDLNVFDDTLFLLTSDHGEDISEEIVKKIGRTSHGRNITDDEFRVPCMFYKKGLIPIKKVNQITRTIDLLPTLIDLNNKNPPKDIDGVSIKDSILKDKAIIDETYLEIYPLYGDAKGIRTLDWLYILKEGEKEELYNIKKDKKLKENLAEKNKEICSKFKFKIKDHFSMKYKPEEKDEYTKEMLKELGYVKEN